MKSKIKIIKYRKNERQTDRDSLIIKHIDKKILIETLEISKFPDNEIGIHQYPTILGNFVLTKNQTAKLIKFLKEKYKK